MELIRLDKLISNQTQLSRSEVKTLIGKGQVRVNANVIKMRDIKVAETDIIEVNGKALSYKKNLYVILNKPEDIVCSTKDGLSKTVLDIIPQELCHKGMFPAGRLDKDSEGMVLLTNDGELAHKILSPKNHIPKYYIVLLEKPFEIDYAEKFALGITLGDGTICRPAKAAKLLVEGNYALVELTEGMFHQVKRMFQAVENRVEKLIRIQMGGLAMPEKLPLGGYIEILHKDVENLLKTTNFNEVKTHLEENFSSYLINNKI